MRMKLRLANKQSYDNSENSKQSVIWQGCKRPQQSQMIQ